jgi:hypothetical protein
MAQRGRPKKDPWADLPEEWKAKMEATKTSVEVRAELAAVALHAQHMRELKEDDNAYLEAKEAYSMAGEIYRDAEKQRKLRTKFCRQLLQARSQPAD